jgi:hypothetical protein
MTSFLRPLVLPLLLVGLLAGILGFFVTRTVAGDTADRMARVSVVGIPPTPTPTPSPSPTSTPGPTDSTTGSGGGSGRDPRCPSGCECSFPPGGTVVVCRGGGTVRIP